MDHLPWGVQPAEFDRRARRIAMNKSKIELARASVLSLDVFCLDRADQKHDHGRTTRRWPFVPCTSGSGRRVHRLGRSRVAVGQAI